MTHTTLIRLSGWGMVAAAICLLLTFVPVPMAFLVAIVLITLGLLGLHARYGAQAGAAAKATLAVGVWGGVAGALSHLSMTLGYENGRTLMNTSMAVMFAGLFAFGLVALRAKPMPRGNALPALAGVWWPVIVVGARLYHQATGQWLNVPFWASFTLFSCMSFFLAWLGYVVQSDAAPQPMPA